MCGIAGIVALPRRPRPSRRPTSSRCATSNAIAVRTTRGCGRRPTAASASATAGSRSSTSRRSATSRCSRPTARCTIVVQRRDLQLPRAAPRARGRWATASARRATPRCCCTATARGGSRCSTACAACSPSRSTTRERRETLLARDPLGHQAALRRRRRAPARVRLRDPGAAPRCWATAAARSGGPRELPALGLDRGRRARSTAGSARCRPASLAARPTRRASRARRPTGASRTSSGARSRWRRRRRREALRAALLDSVAPSPGGRRAGRRLPLRRRRLVGAGGAAAEVLPAPMRTRDALASTWPSSTRARLARAAAELYGTEHHDVPIRIEEVRERIADAVRALDQPIDRRHQHLLRLARPRRRPASRWRSPASGGDELFGGYASFERVPRIRRLHARLARWPGGGALAAASGARSARLPLRRAPARSSRARSRSAATTPAPTSSSAALLAARGARAARAGARARRSTPATRSRSCARACDTEQLPEDERVCALEFAPVPPGAAAARHRRHGMRHSLEVRTPLVDRDLLRAAARIPASLRRAGPAKRALREAPRPPRAAGALAAPQAGLHAAVRALAAHRRDRARAARAPVAARRRGCARLVADFQRGRVHWSRVWALLVLREFLA